MDDAAYGCAQADGPSLSVQFHIELIGSEHPIVMIEPEDSKPLGRHRCTVSNTQFLGFLRVIAHPQVLQIEFLDSGIVYLYPSAIIPTRVIETVYIGSHHLIDAEGRYRLRMQRG